MSRGEEKVEVGENDTERKHQDYIEEEDLVDDLIYVRLLESILSLVQYQLRVVAGVQYEQV